MLCPNICGTLNHDVPRRWKHSEESEGKSPPTPAGRKKKFTDVLFTVIADFCHHVTDKIPVSVSVLKPLVDGAPGIGFAHMLRQSFQNRLRKNQVIKGLVDLVAKTRAVLQFFTERVFWGLGK
eukprot:4305456-Amphidinium_carterae.1